MSTELFNELQRMKQKDISTRQKLLDEGHLYECYADEIQKVHIDNAVRLNEIVEQHGWPGESLVGLEGSRAAWLVAQHAICRPALLMRFCSEIEEAFNFGEVPKKQMVLLQDQILFQQNKPQKCGWVYDWQPDGKMGCIVESVEQANLLRAEFGVSSYEDALEEHRAHVAREGGSMPDTYKIYRSRADAWRKNVGWL